MNIVVHAIDFLKTAKNICAVWLFTALILFAPSWLVEQIGIMEFAPKYRMWLALGFLAATALCLVNIGLWMWGWVSKILEQLVIIWRLHQLSSDEKRILRYFSSDSKTHMFKVTDGVVGGLEKTGIIYRSSDWRKVDRVAYNIQDWIWAYLKKHPNLIDEGNGGQ